ncbi:disease resistance protein RPM1-like isoform X2 [Ziziphus jujuba]|uniref:Disease resistance protein RPM1-like isoform X2 n=1 Tax=Ziziphus jujuba TaxID=326968 RepID=A0ABM4A5D4_ZIZJJ|nr:disease resistance protein RPM1-like isoform X2 [Ziziphus jujuba]
MAEIALGLVVDHLIPILFQEASLQKSVHSEVSEIKYELQIIQCFLKDADWRAENEGDTTRDGVKVWVEQVREVSFQIEDVIDEYTLHLVQLPCHHHRHGRVVGSLHKIGRSVIKVKLRSDIVSHIQNIKATVLEIKERSARYGFDSIHHQGNWDSHTWYDPRKGTVFLEEAEVVGIESHGDKLIGWLMDKSRERSVVAVVGMGGVGKTTLAKRVYDQVIGNFDCHAWITVSESYNKMELLEKLMDKFCLPPCMGSNRTAMEETEREKLMINSIRKFLKKKMYVVLFDDVWKVEFWSDIEHALFDNKKGGRIVITTRRQDVADFCKKSSFVHVYMMKPLNLRYSWRLFCNKAFQFEFGGRCPVELKNFSHKIVQRCKGLPLAIVAIAGLLSTKEKTVDEWRKLHDNLSSELESNPHLTEDYEINCSRLIRQWISEGFIASKKDRTLELVAQEYLTELVNRSLVQVSKVSFGGKVKECCIHDLLREMSATKMRDLHFGCPWQPYESEPTRLTRRLSIDDAHYVLSTMRCRIKSRHIRSLLIFNKDGIRTIFLETTFSATFKLLKVLDFEGASDVNDLPKDIGNLFHLKYLSVAGTKVKVLPKSIGNLVKLETLDLQHSSVRELPVEINRLQKLRHLLSSHVQITLYNSFVLNGVKLQQGFGSLAALQKLYYVEPNDKLGVDELMAELRKLTQLKKLGIVNLKIRDGGRSLCECINEMKHLESLRVSSVIINEMVFDLDNLSSPPEFLRSLYFRGRLRKLPEWITKLRNLAKLEIRGSGLKDDPIKLLQNLHNLVMLKMAECAYDGEKLHFKQGVFPKLKYVYLQTMAQLNSLVIEEGAMPNLEQLFIWFCQRLKEVPFGIKHLRNLKKLCFFNIPPELEKGLQPEGKYYHVVRHVPEVVFQIK